MQYLSKRARLAALLFAFAAATAVADEESETREAIRSLIDDLAVRHTNSRELDLKAKILKCKDAARLYVEETVAHPLRPNDHGAFPTALHYVFDDRRDDFIVLVRGLLQDPSEEVARYGVRLAADLELGAKVGPELLGLFDRKDGALFETSNWAFRRVQDPKIVERLIAEASKVGDRADAALSALLDIDTPAAHAHLRKVAKDPSASRVRRDWAVQGLAPFLDGEDERTALDALASNDEKLVTAAFIAFSNSQKLPPMAALRHARSLIWEAFSDQVETMLTRGGDEEIVPELLGRARASSDPRERQALFERAAVSPRSARVAMFAKALAGETDAFARVPLLEALGGSGDPAARDGILPLLSSADSGQDAAKALAALVRSGGVQRIAAIQSILEEKQSDLLVAFDEGWLGRSPEDADRLELLTFLVDLLEKNAATDTARVCLVGGLKALTSVNFGDERENVRDWRAWLDQEKVQKD